MFPSFFMDENDLKLLISAYQSKSADLLAQVISAEARILKSQQIIESLTSQIQELNSQQNTFEDKMEVSSPRKRTPK
tara:strand:- start:2796 stop:3026 length:231 start_codon:yes stop_codon:yes gene_type:complete